MDKKILSSSSADKYIHSCDLAFELYSKNIIPMQNYLKEKTPINDLYFDDSDTQKESIFDNLKSPTDIENAKKIYASTVKAKTLDILRNLLPSSTLTNLAISGNGRAFEYLLFNMFSSNLSELQDIGNHLFGELEKYVKRLSGAQRTTCIVHFIKTIWRKQKIPYTSLWIQRYCQKKIIPL